MLDKKMTRLALELFPMRVKRSSNYLVNHLQELHPTAAVHVDL